MLTVNKIRASGFEPGHTTQWSVYFTNRNNGDKLNLIDNYAPVLEYSYSIEVNKAEKEYTPLRLKIAYPISVQYITNLRLQFLDDKEFTILNILESRQKEIFKNGTPSIFKLKDLSWECVIETYNKQRELIKSEYFYVIPFDNIEKRGDQGFSNYNFDYNFIVVDKK